MTSSTDTTGHPDVAEISDLTEDLLSASRTAAVRRHLDGCAHCADVHASLEEVRSLLRALPEPAGMPAVVADRIDAALAAEIGALRPTTSESPEEPVAGGPGSAAADEVSPNLSGSDADAHVSRETSSSADRPAGRPAAATGPGRGEDRRRRRRRTVALSTVLTVAVLGVGSLFFARWVVDGDAQTPAHGTRTTAAGTFSQSTIKSQVDDLLSTQKRSQPSTGSKNPDLGIESQSHTPDSAKSAETLIQPSVSVPGCVRQGIGDDGDVLGAKKGTYDGKDAYLVVLPDAADSSRVTAYVVDTACVGQQPASAGKVLLKQSLARP